MSSPRISSGPPRRISLTAALLFVLTTLCSLARTPNPEPRIPLAARDIPPTVPAPKPFVLPAPTVSTLSNSLKVVVLERHSLPLITLHLVVKAGAEFDPPGLPGAAQFVASLLNEGTERRSAHRIAEAIDSAGGNVDTGADWDNSFIALSVLIDHTELAFDLLSDMTIHPAFRSDEVERLRKQTLSALDVLRGDPTYLADSVFERLIFDGTPYSHPADGTPSAVRQLTAENLKEFHHRHYSPSQAFLAVVGDIKAKEGLDYAQKFFGAWRDDAGSGPAGPSSAPGNPNSVGGGRVVVVVDKPDAVQTEIRVGNFGIPRDSPDYYALTVANQILGGPASNHLFSALRSQHGLTYGASSDLLCYRYLGSWEAKTSTRTSETVKTVQMTLEQMKRLRDHSISGVEVENAQSYLIGHRALEFETSDGIATQVLDWMTHGLPLDDWNLFPERIQSLTSEDVWRATRRYLDPDRAVIVLVGNGEAFKKDLKKLGPFRIIPLQSLDLASADLVGKSESRN